MLHEEQCGTAREGEADRRQNTRRMTGKGRPAATEAKVSRERKRERGREREREGERKRERVK